MALVTAENSNYSKKIHILPLWDSSYLFRPYLFGILNEGKSWSYEIAMSYHEDTPIQLHLLLHEKLSNFRFYANLQLLLRFYTKFHFQCMRLYEPSHCNSSFVSLIFTPL